MVTVKYSTASNCTVKYEKKIVRLVVQHRSLYPATMRICCTGGNKQHSLCDNVARDKLRNFVTRHYRTGNIQY